MALTYTVADFTTGATVSASDLNSRFSDVQTKFAAQITNADISSSAAISITKIDNNVEHMLVNFHIGNMYGVTQQTWPAANAILQLIPIPNDNKGSWVVSAGECVFTDMGDDTARMRIEWGHYTGGVWGVDVTVVAGVALNSDDSAANTAGGQTLIIAAGTLTAGSHRCLALVSDNDDTGGFSANTDKLAVGLKLYRIVANG